ncbi:MAG: hypothetical protein Q8P48_07400 [Deltaproteobacteria bacterium]|nr:hypothetical protein [Deltaproteobacteria bacterium]
MKQREAVERVVGRIYRDRLEKTGRLPAPKEVREMEKKAREAAEGVEKRKKIR